MAIGAPRRKPLAPVPLHPRQWDASEVCLLPTLCGALNARDPQPARGELERETGFEPATYGLEGRHSTN
jgi:hypothetical protein